MDAEGQKLATLPPKAGVGQGWSQLSFCVQLLMTYNHLLMISLFVDILSTDGGLEGRSLSLFISEQMEQHSHFEHSWVSEF